MSLRPASLHHTLHVGDSNTSSTELRALRNTLSSFLTDRCIPDDQVRAIVLAFSEALDNAVEHGLGGHGELKVRMRFTPRFIMLSLIDAGSDRVPLGLPVDPGDDADRGRGFQLMNKLMDYVRVKAYPAGGTRVTMLRRLES